MRAGASWPTGAATRPTTRTTYTSPFLRKDWTPASSPELEDVEGLSDHEKLQRDSWPSSVAGMTNQSSTRISSIGARATGATSTGASSVAFAALLAAAVGAGAMGALAIGAVAIGRLGIGQATVRRLRIDEWRLMSFG